MKSIIGLFTTISIIDIGFRGSMHPLFKYLKNSLYKEHFIKHIRQIRLITFTIYYYTSCLAAITYILFFLYLALTSIDRKVLL